MAAEAAGTPTCYQLAPRLKGFDGPTVWHEFTPLAKEVGAVNLGQGFPDWQAPAFMKAAAKRAVDEDYNQYTRSGGHVPLVQQLAKWYKRVLQRDIDAMTEVTVTVGATEAMFALLQALVADGDEVLLMEPSFDIYSAQTRMAGGSPVYVPLQHTGQAGVESTGSAWGLDLPALEAAITPATRILVLNTPHNPTGKMFSREEMQGIADIVARHPRIVVICDEVYEHMTYDGHDHVQFPTLPGMWERSVTVSSAGKTFSVTGWKVGWVVGPAPLVKGVMLVNQWVQFSVATPLQQAVAWALEEAEQPFTAPGADGAEVTHDSYFAYLRAQYLAKRTLLCDALNAAGLKAIAPEGGFFVMADTSAVSIPDSYLAESTPACPSMTRDWAFCRWLTKEVGVAAIPPSAFYQDSDKHLVANLARFAFCKTDEALTEAAGRLAKLAPAGTKPAGE